jgi:DNA-directed RNA polymerase II subunit RPB2
MSQNHVYVFAKKAPTKFSFIAEIKSCPDSGARPPSTMFLKLLARGQIKASKKAGQTVQAQIPYIKQDLPLGIVFRALGFVADREILERICYDFEDEQMMEALRPSMEESNKISTAEQALDFIGKRGIATGVARLDRINYAKDILQKEMLPHVGVQESFETKKAYFVGYMVHRLLLAHLGRTDCDDRDHYGNKRLDLAGALMSGLFRQLFKKVSKEVSANLQKNLNSGKDPNLILSCMPATITGGLKYCLATGNWGTGKQVKPGQAAKTGVSQVLNRLSYASTLSHLRRLNTPIGRDGKLAKPRQLHNTHWGMVCPAETPEGQAVGLVKNLALMAMISVGSAAAPVLQFMDEWALENLEEISPRVIPKATKIFVNGCWVGIHRDPEQLLTTLRELRRKMDLSIEMSVVRDIHERELRVYTDPGRCMRPLLIVDAHEQKLKIKRSHIQEMHVAEKEGQQYDFNWSDIVSRVLRTRLLFCVGAR